MALATRPAWKRKSGDRILEFEGLRGVLAWIVVAAHSFFLCGWSGRSGGGFSVLFHAAEAAVNLFMMLSGFAITHLLIVQKERFGAYIWRRGCRIVPAYWAALTIAVLLNRLMMANLSHLPPTPERDGSLLVSQLGQSRWWIDVPLHLGLLHGLPPFRWLPFAPFTYLGIAWTLSLEWQFYWAAPLALAVALRSRLGAAIVIGGAAVTCCFAATITGAFSEAFLPVKALFIIVGSVTYFALNGSLTSRNSLLVLAVSPVAAALLWWIGSGAGIDGAMTAAAWLAVTAAVRFDAFQPINRFLNSAVIQHLGRISYSTYLFHVPVLTLVQAGIWHWLKPGALWQLGLGTAVAGAVGTLAVAEGGWRLIERPFQRLGRRPPAALR